MNERQKRFAEFYAANPNAAEAARSAGYSKKTARSIGQKLLTKDDILKYIRELQDKAAESRIMSLSQIKAYWSDTVNNPMEKTSERLKASALLAKSAGAFISSDDIEEKGERGDVIIYLPKMMSEEQCLYEGSDEAK